MSTPLEQRVLEQAVKLGVRNSRIVHSSQFYATGRDRLAVVTGELGQRQVALKMWDDPRGSDEPFALQAWHGQKIQGLHAPELIQFHVEDVQRGWALESALPAGHALGQPLVEGEREILLRAYRIYRKGFAIQPHRELNLIEMVPADQYHMIRLSRWFELAGQAESNLALRGESRLLMEADMRIVSRALTCVMEATKDVPMIWSHGQFKASDVFLADDNGLWLINFAHTRFYPQNYEFAYMVWADALVSGTWNVSYEQWRATITSWEEEYPALAAEFGWKPEWLKPALLERALGSLLADVVASSRPRDEQEGRVKLLLRFIGELIA